MRLHLIALVLLAGGLASCADPAPEPVVLEMNLPARPPLVEPVNCDETSCPVERNFVITYGDRGLDDNNLGRIFQLAARTHERQVRANAFPGVPEFRPTDRITTVHIGSVSDLESVMSVGNIVYLAYFGHSLNEGAGALLIGQAPAPDTNLTNSPGANNTPVTVLVPSDLRSDAQIRLFGCRGAYGEFSISEQMAKFLHVPVFGYANDGGSIGTTDPRLGHGRRAATKRDVSAVISGSAPDVWLVPAAGTPRFRRF